MADTDATAGRTSTYMDVMSTDAPEADLTATADGGAPEPVTMADSVATRSNGWADHAMSIAWRKLTYYWGMLLLGFAVSVVMTGIGTSVNNPPWPHTLQGQAGLEIVVFWVMLWWIALLEGCQISIVGLQGCDVESFKDTHPRAYRCCKVVHKGANVERFLVGRQFLLLFNGFLVSRIGGGGPLVGTNFQMGDWTWNSDSTSFFVGNGTLLMVVIVALGQLPTQLVAADKMLGFFNLPFLHYEIIVVPCLWVEYIGLTHSSYLLKDALCWFSGIDQAEADPEKAMTKDFTYYAKCLISVAAVIFSGTFIIKGLALGQTNATAGPGWENLSAGAAIVVSLLFIFMLACAEGLQVSALALARTPVSELKTKSPLAYRTCQVLYTGRNMQAFLVGRQFLTAMNMVLLSKVTSYSGSGGVLSPPNSTDWGMGENFNNGLLQTGFLGAILVVNVAQLASQVTASIFPASVINNHFMYWLLQLMLLVEASGIVNACWPLAWGLDKLFRIPTDPDYYNGKEDTIAKGILERKRSMGLPVTEGVDPLSLYQPEQEFHVTYTYTVQYVDPGSAPTTTPV
jgi:hypothetical protein